VKITDNFIKCRRGTGNPNPRLHLACGDVNRVFRRYLAIEQVYDKGKEELCIGRHESTKAFW
jgi:hypothetical protein